MAFNLTDFNPSWTRQLGWFSLLYELHWVKVTERIQFKSCFLAYRVCIEWYQSTSSKHYAKHLTSMLVVIYVVGRFITAISDYSLSIDSRFQSRLEQPSTVDFSKPHRWQSVLRRQILKNINMRSHWFSQLLFVGPISCFVYSAPVMLLQFCIKHHNLVIIKLTLIIGMLGCSLSIWQ